MMLFFGTALENVKRNTKLLNVSVDVTIFELCAPILQLIMGFGAEVSARRPGNLLCCATSRTSLHPH